MATETSKGASMHILDFLIFQEKGLHAKELTIEEVFGNSVFLS